MWAAALLTGCGREPVPERQASPEGGSPVELIGDWAILRIDGRAPASPRKDAAPRLVVRPDRYSASVGCNELGGLGVQRGDRFYTAPGPQTLVACLGDAARQEEVLASVMRSSPVATRAQGDELLLRGRIRRYGRHNAATAAELAPGEFSSRVRACIEEHGARTIVVDSLNGYQAAMPGEHALVLHMHELLQYLNRRGVTTILTVAQHGLVGDMKTPVDVTYLADTVVLLRYFEATGRVRRAISVVKKRMGEHETTIREYQIGARGITLGEPLTGFQGILRGVPVLLGDAALLKREDA